MNDGHVSGFHHPFDSPDKRRVGSSPLLRPIGKVLSRNGLPPRQGRDFQLNTVLVWIRDASSGIMNGTWATGEWSESNDRPYPASAEIHGAGARHRPYCWKRLYKCQQVKHST